MLFEVSEKCRPTKCSGLDDVPQCSFQSQNFDRAIRNKLNGSVIPGNLKLIWFIIA